MFKLSELYRSFLAVVQRARFWMLPCDGNKVKTQRFNVLRLSFCNLVPPPSICLRTSSLPLPMCFVFSPFVRWRSALQARSTRPLLKLHEAATTKLRLEGEGARPSPWCRGQAGRGGGGRGSRSDRRVVAKKELYM